jgi:hypothetical protein
VNIAFPAFLLFLFLVPGFILRGTFRTLEGTNLDAGPFASSSIKGVVYALLLNVAGWGFVERYTTFSVRWDALLALFLADKSSNTEDALALISAHPFAHVAYFVCLYGAAAVSGWTLRYLTLRFKWDREGKFFAPLLRLSNPWFYLFRGYDEAREPDFIYVTTVIDLGEPILYQGLLKNFYLNGDGGLDRLVLSKAKRRKLSQDKQTDGQVNPAFYSIEGDFFILRYPEMVTLNVYYLYAEVAEKGGQPAQVHDSNEGITG